MESGVAAEAEVEVAAEVEVGADYPFVHHIISYGWSNPSANIIYTTCKSFFLVDSLVR